MFSVTPSALQRLERPSVSPGAEAPAPETPLPARATGERVYRVGGVLLDLVPGDRSAARGEWADALQPAMFRAYVGRAPGA